MMREPARAGAAQGWEEGTLFHGAQQDMPTRKKKVEFKIKAPDATRVQLVGTFNNWTPEPEGLKKGRTGVWKTALSLPPGEIEYKFIVDGQWIPDPDCPDSVPNSYGTTNSRRTV